jgi:2-polyprenyl-3-methyl-5-hydroxy-6-metoxy-1,4-benzoquinol methylase
VSDAEPTVTPTVDRVYEQRFLAADAQRKSNFWRELARYLQRFVPRDGTILDLACDRGDFIANVAAAEKWATDVRDVSAHLPRDVRFVQADGLLLHQKLPNEHFDLVFTSNYLEHLPSGDAVVEQLEVVAKLLTPRGRVMILQPNIRLTGAAYWDFIDHKVALTERSLVEAAELCGFETERLIKRFLPYTTKSRLPQSRFAVRLYLAFRPAWFFLGKQTLYVGRRG